MIKPCHIVVSGDSTECKVCDLRWDTNDDGPACPRNLPMDDQDVRYAALLLTTHLLCELAVYAKAVGNDPFKRGKPEIIHELRSVIDRIERAQSTALRK